VVEVVVRGGRSCSWVRFVILGAEGQFFFVVARFIVCVVTVLGSSFSLLLPWMFLRVGDRPLGRRGVLAAASVLPAFASASSVCAASLTASGGIHSLLIGV
jgi:uncharacterized membrane protein